MKQFSKCTSIVQSGKRYTSAAAVAAQLQQAIFRIMTSLLTAAATHADSKPTCANAVLGYTEQCLVEP